MTAKSLISRQDYPAFVALVSMVLWFGNGMVLEGQVPFFRDLGMFFYPMRYSLAESLKAGDIPLWDRRMAMGFPLLANFQSGSFYPPHILLLVLRFFDAIRVLYVFHYLVAATGSYTLCRRWKYRPYLALIGALLFTLGGATVSLTNLLNHFQAAVWLPWLVFFWERSLQSKTWKSFLTFSLVLLCQFLAGSPEIYAMTLALLVLDGLRLRKEEGAIPCHTLFLHLLAANVLVAGLGMAQILPSVELLLHSRARGSVTYAGGVKWSLHPLSFMNLFFLDKEVALDTATGLQPFFSRDIPLIISLYLGVIALPGISLWLWKSSLKEKALLLGALMGSAILALGAYTPVYRFLFRTIFPFSLIRFPEKFVFVTCSLLLFVALRGLFRFFHSDSSIRPPLLILSSIWLLYMVLYLILRTHTAELAQFISAATQTSISSPLSLGKTTAVIASAERQVLLISGIVLLLLLGKKEAVNPALLKTLLVGLTFLDLYSAHRPYQYLLDPKIMEQAPRVLALPDGGRLFYIPSLTHLRPDYFVSSKSSFRDRTAAFFANLFPNTGIVHGFEYMQETDPLERWPYSTFLKAANALPPEKLYRLVGALNVRHLISRQPLTGGGVTLVREFPEYPTWVYRVDHTVPRVFVASKCVVESDPMKAIIRLSSSEFDPVREVIVERPLAIPPAKNSQAEARISLYSHRRVSILATVSGTGVLVLADSFYPGWRAYVDGQEREILRANVFFRGVVLSEGKHLVEFRYEPRAFKVGLMVSIAVLLVVTFCSLAVCLKSLKRSRQPI
ncbi:MAG: YfhO family protein [Deltaproteobacteria bacterium]|nr:YfhO family protein [Deltaproteobacteria bacterium]